MHINKKRGSILIDAAICIPLFVISMALIIGLIIQAGKEQRAYSRLTALADAAMAVQSSGEITIPAAAGDALIQICYRPWIGLSDSDEASSYVYVFPKYGERYHIQGCFTMERYPENYFPMDRKEAEEKGYSPCLVCIGNE